MSARPPRVRILGHSVAAFAALRALRRLSITAAIEATPSRPSPMPPALVLDETAIHLIGDIFGTNVFSGAWQLRHRVVRWEHAELRMAQPAICIRGSTLSDAIAKCSDLAVDAGCHVDSDFTLLAAAHSQGKQDQSTFGHRVTLTCEVGLPTGEDTSACRIECTSGGWVFLSPVSADRAVLQVTVPEQPSGGLVEAINAVTESCAAPIRNAGRRIEATVAALSSAPSIARTLSGNSWFCIGSGAMRLDPICGDGTAQSIRTGLLAAACASKAMSGGLAPEALGHYEGRIHRTFAAHLRACAQSYASGPFGPCWSEELLRIYRSAQYADDNSLWTPRFTFRNGELRDISDLAEMAQNQEDPWTQSQIRCSLPT